MATNAQNQKKSNSELIPLNISKLSNLQYIKIIYVDTNKELFEICTQVQTINNDIIQLCLNSKENINITCPTGVALKLVTMDAIYFAKAILKEIRRVHDKFIFILDTPRKTIRQQNRKSYRINIDCPCVLLVNNDKNKNLTYIAQTVNISKGGVLIHNIESMLNDEPVGLQLSKGESCHFVLFLEQNIKIKLSAKLVRSEYINDKYRYAFQFLNIFKKYTASFDKYLTNEEFKLLKMIKNR